MSRKLLIALLAFLLAAVTAWADPGGEGGCVNLPGGRTGPQPSGAGSGFTTTVVEQNGVVFVLPAEMAEAVAVVRGNDLPFVLYMSTEGGKLHLSAELLALLRAAHETSFVIDFVDDLGNRMTVKVLLEAGQVLRVFA